MTVVLLFVIQEEEPAISLYHAYLTCTVLDKTVTESSTAIQSLHIIAGLVTFSQSDVIAR